MKKIIVSLLIVSFFISSCAHSYSIDSKETKLQFYDRVNKQCIGKENVFLIKKDGDKIKVNSFSLAPDSTIYSEFELCTAGYIKTDDLSQIEFRNQSKSGKIFLGMGFGAILAFPLCLLAAIVYKGGEPGPWQLLFILPAIGAIIGASVGLSSGPDIIKLQ